MSSFVVEVRIEVRDADPYNEGTLELKYDELVHGPSLADVARDVAARAGERVAEQLGAGQQAQS